MKKKILYARPSISKLEISLVEDAIKNGWGENCYDYVKKFEDSFKNYIDAKFAISTSSCTGALHMGLAAIGIGDGDEVILADTNWIATVSPIVQLGAKPVFVDILQDTWCIDPIKVELAITPATKAIVATHLYGNLCEMDKLKNISKKYGLKIIEDSAEGIGSIYQGLHVGSIGDFGTFSFHGSKTLTTGEGGMFVTNDENLFELVQKLSNHGRRKSELRQFWPEEIGFKYKLSNLQAALGFGQVQRLGVLVDRKREILRKYKDRILGLPGIQMNPEVPGTTSGAWMPTVVFPEGLNINQNQIIKKMHEENIDARIFFWPLSSLPMFEKNSANKNSYSISERAINLPSFHDMTDAEIDTVSRVVESLYYAGQ